jgi:predicted Zn-dependent protease
MAQARRPFDYPCCSMTQTAEELFDSSIARYQAGESVETLIPIFKDICDRTPKSSPSWTCLSWLYLLDGKPEQALKAAQKGVKLNPQDPQARINLSMAMIETGKKGVREHVDVAYQLVTIAKDLRSEIDESFADGLKRNPDWASLKKVQAWINGD